jgi:hypothetical protein
MKDRVIGDPLQYCIDNNLLALTKVDSDAAPPVRQTSGYRLTIKWGERNGKDLVPGKLLYEHVVNGSGLSERLRVFNPKDKTSEPRDINELTTLFAAAMDLIKENALATFAIASDENSESYKELSLAVSTGDWEFRGLCGQVFSAVSLWIRNRNIKDIAPEYVPVIDDIAVIVDSGRVIGYILSVLQDTCQINAQTISNTDAILGHVVTKMNELVEYNSELMLKNSENLEASDTIYTVDEGLRELVAYGRV